MLNEVRWTALHYAATKGLDEICFHLASQASRGARSLCASFAHSIRRTVCLGLARATIEFGGRAAQGADIHIRDQAGISPLDLSKNDETKKAIKAGLKAFIERGRVPIFVPSANRFVEEEAGKQHVATPPKVDAHAHVSEKAHSRRAG